MTLGNTLKHKRESLNLLPEDVAKAVGVSERFVRYLEKDERLPSLDILKKICKVLKINKLPIQ